ncbi:Enterobactin exporter EntS [Austwickia sp. TVS 96-490-7B]|uniref:MFS transporter n=1 Tax=Austwickia sp. TVS 96-490-7B TaxID=2830843 RepID=UPI001C56B7E1|nr:MFS transporter [Austwickia sp. TVS 96-490-7B]MBW3086339.1 Enterobactin exporter EntS [Austwickia sp. TVS 96-490-7B]
MSGDSAGAPLTFPEFRRYWLAVVCSEAGNALIPFATVLAVSAITGSALAVGQVLAAQTAAQLVGLLVGGTLADLVGRRSLMVACDIVRAMTQLVTGALLWMEIAEVWHLCTLAVISGVATSLFRPASMGMVIDLLPSHLLRQGNAWLAMATDLLGIIGPGAAGVLALSLGAGSAFVADGVSFLASAVCLFRIAAPSRGGESRQPFLAEAMLGWRELVRHRWLVTQVAWDAISIVLVVAPFLALAPFISDKVYGGKAAWAAALICTSVGALLGSTCAVRFRPRYPLRLTSIAAPLSIAVSSIALVLQAPSWLFCIFQALYGAMLAIAATFWFTLLQQHISSDRLSRVGAVDSLVSFALLPLGYGLAAPAAEEFGSSAVLCSGVVIASVGALLVSTRPSIRGLQFVDDVAARPEGH